ncbi:MAG TPA: hypothetical protein PKD03_02825 [Ignavibacteriaceae bacterium]|nr:hypothetical protein [Ignavibacteriaceae bacterium]
MNKISGDILARIRFFSIEEGGRQSPTRTNKHACIICFSGKYYDCLLILETHGSIFLGEKAEIPIKFLIPSLILDKLHQGDKFKLMAARIIGEGEVLSII